jgi:guanylate kinase
MSAAGKSSQKKGVLFVVSGPSGSGKTTLINRALEDARLKKRLIKSVSFTSRPKRSNESGLKDYRFISQAAFRQKLRDKKILEWTKYLGYYYGTPKDSVERKMQQSKGIFLCLDFKGAQRIRRLYPRNTVTIFVMPASIGDLFQRIKGRCVKTKNDEIRRRIALAKEEMENARSYDFTIINKKLPQAIKKMKDIVAKELHIKSNLKERGEIWRT